MLRKKKHLSLPSQKLQPRQEKKNNQASCPLDWFRDPKLCLAVLSEIREELRPAPRWVNPRSSWAVAASSSFKVAAPPRIIGEALRINPFFLREGFSKPRGSSEDLCVAAKNGGIFRSPKGLVSCYKKDRVFFRNDLNEWVNWFFLTHQKVELYTALLVSGAHLLQIWWLIPMLLGFLES